MFDNNVNQQIPFQTLRQQQIAQPQVPMQAVGMENVNPELLRENIQDTYVANRVADTTDDPKAMMGTAALMVPTWFAITQGMDVFAKHSRGAYENTLQYKIAKFGDKVADSSFAKSGFAQSVNNGIKSALNFVKTKIVDNSRLLRSMFYTPSIPENGMAVANYKGMIAMQLFDYPQHGEAFVKPLKSAADLDCYGATAQEIKDVETKLAKVKLDSKKAEILQQAEFDIIKKNTRDIRGISKFTSKWATADAKGKAKILKDMKAFEWGYDDFAHMERLAKKTHDNIPEIFKATKNANPKMFARIWGSNKNAAGKLATKVVGREVYASETLNKLFAELGNLDLSKPENAKWKQVLTETGYIDKLPKSNFAKYLNKYTHLVTEGATNRVAGGKFIALMQAWFLAEAIYKAAKAEGGIGEKGRTFAERVTELVAMFACIPLALKLMHGICGLQYAGMTKEQVEAYRRHLKIHNDTAMRGGFKTEKAWKASRDNLKNELKAGVKNPFVKLAKKIGRIVTVGLEQIRPYDKKDIADIATDGTKTYRKGIMSKLRDLWRHPKFGIKQMAGYPMRIGIGMMLIMPILTKTAVKAEHLIFGKPKHSVLDEGKEEEEKTVQTQTELPPQLQNPQLAQQQAIQQQTQQQTANNGQTTITTETTVNNPQEPVRTYIPSPIGVQITGGEDLSPADAAMRRADIAEQQALQALKMG